MGETVRGTWEAKDGGQLCTTLASTSRGSGVPNTVCRRYEKVGKDLYILDENGNRTSDKPTLSIKAGN